MTPEAWWTWAGAAASLFPGAALTGLYFLASRQRAYRSRHRHDAPSGEHSAQFRAVAGFLERYASLGDPRQKHYAS
jgi:hypothetical protein